jgi:hypothetical protein
MIIENGSFFPLKENDDVDIAKRLIKAYKNTVNQDVGNFKKLSLNDLWSLISNDSFVSTLTTLLNNEDAVAISDYLNGLGNKPTWYGGIHTCGMEPNTSHTLGDYTFKEIERLSASIGLDLYESDTPTSIIIRLCSFFDFNIIPPPVIPVAGMKTVFGILNDRHVNSLYLANLIKKFTSEYSNICEFGGGLGLNAFYLYEMNRKNVHLFDLPFVNVISGYFLIKALGNDSVVLEGEDIKSNAIHIKAFWNCENYPKDYFEVTANQDSFPEIDENIVIKYISEIESNTKSYFLSINHEHEANYADNKTHISVPKTISWFSNYKKVLRKPYVLRSEFGYFEEHYKIIK